MSPKPSSGQFVLCVNNAGYAASLEMRKVYAALPDPHAGALGLVRVVDESGEDYLYPESHFVSLELPPEAADEILSATDAS